MSRAPSALERKLREQVEVLSAALGRTAEELRFLAANVTMPKATKLSLELLARRCDADSAGLDIELRDLDVGGLGEKTRTVRRTAGKVLTAAALFLATPPGEDVWQQVKRAADAVMSAVDDVDGTLRTTERAAQLAKELETSTELLRFMERTEAGYRGSGRNRRETRDLTRRANDYRDERRRLEQEIGRLRSELSDIGGP